MAAPPPPGGYHPHATAPPPAQPNVVYVQQQQPKVMYQQKGGLLNEIGSAGRSLFHEAKSAGTTVWKNVDPQGYQVHQNTQTTLSTGNIVQLVSRASGRSLQVVASPQGPLVIDGKGPEGANPEFWFTHWTVYREKNSVVRLYNNQNYLAIVNGLLTVMSFPPAGLPPSLETQLKFRESGHFVAFESVKQPGCYVGVNPDGTVKSALVTGFDNSSHFGLRLVYSAQPVPPVIR